MRKFYLTCAAALAATSMAFGAYNEEVITLPEGLQAEPWVMTYDSETRLVDVAIDGDQIYLGNLTDSLADSYVLGEIVDGVATFPLTYMGYSDLFDSSIYFVPGTWVERIEDYKIGESFSFAYDAEAKTLTTLELYAAIFIGTDDTVGALAPGWLEYFYEPTIEYLDPAMADAPLQDPEFLAAFNMREYYGSDEIDFFLPSSNEGGYPLDTERLYYIFYVDGEPFTFNTDEYLGLPYDMTEIPYDFFDEDFWDIFCDGQFHSVALYIENYSTVGVKMFYTDAEGNVIKETAYVEANIYELSEGEISGIAAPTTAKEVKSVAYYDLSGRKLASAPAAGICIAVTTFADGSTITRKIATR